MENSTNYKVCLTSDARNDIVEIKDRMHWQSIINRVKSFDQII